MRHPTDDGPPTYDGRRSDWSVAAAMALSIVICLAAFVWIFVELDPFLDDFTGSDMTITADPFASPVDEPNDVDSSPSP